MKSPAQSLHNRWIKRRRKAGVRTSSVQRKRSELRCFQLEDRTAPAAFVWDGGGGDGLWSNPVNWDVGGSNPAAAPGFTDGVTDDVTINAAGTYTVTLDVNITETASGDPLNNLTINAAGATLSSSGKTITVNGTATISQGKLNWNNSIWAGTGTFTNAGSVVMFDNNVTASRIDVPVTNQGSFIIQGSDNQFTNASIHNDTTGTLSIQTSTNYGSGRLSLTGGMTNKGLVELRSPTISNYVMELNAGGTVVNESGAKIDVLRTGSGGPTALLAAALDNKGTINFTLPVGSQSINRSGAAHTNSGTINVTGAVGLSLAAFSSFQNDGTISISGTGADLAITGASQASSTFNNTGSLTVSAGDLTTNQLKTLTNSATGTISVSGGNWSLTNFTTFENDGAAPVAAGKTLSVSSGTINIGATGTLGGNGTLTFNTVTLNVAGAYSPGIAAVNLNNSVIGGAGSFTNAGSVVMVDASTTPSRFDVPVTNQGSWVVLGIDNQFTSGSILNDTSGTLSIQATNTIGSGRLTLTGGMTNKGVVELRSTATSSFEMSLTAGGTVVNESGAKIEVLRTSTGSPTALLAAALDNKGTINFTLPSGSQSISKSGAAHSNSGTINITGAVDVSFNTFASLQNTGTIQGSAGGGLNLTGLTSVQNDGTISLTGTGSNMNVTGASQATSTFTNTGSISAKGGLGAR